MIFGREDCRFLAADYDHCKSRRALSPDQDLIWFSNILAAPRPDSSVFASRSLIDEVYMAGLLALIFEGDFNFDPICDDFAVLQLHILFDNLRNA